MSEGWKNSTVPPNILNSIYICILYIYIYMYIYVCIGELNHDWFGKWPLIIKLRLHRLYPVPTMRCTTPTVFYCRIGEINSLKKLITNTIVIVEKCILKCHQRYLHQFDCPSKNRLRKIAHMVSASISWMIKLPRDMINNCIWYMFDKTSGYIQWYITIVNWITRNKLQRNFNQCAMVFKLFLKSRLQKVAHIVTASMG